MSRRTLVLLIFALFLILAVVVNAQPNAGDDGTEVRIVPQQRTLRPGEQFSVEVWVYDIANLYGADVQPRFDPARLKIIDASPVSPGVQIVPRSDLLVPDLVVRRTADNLAGTIWYAATQLNPRPPASGSGALFSFTVEAIAPGPAAITIPYQKLANQDAEPIPVKTGEALYWITPEGEPPSQLLLPLVLNAR